MAIEERGDKTAVKIVRNATCVQIGRRGAAKGFLPVLRKIAFEVQPVGMRLSAAKAMAEAGCVALLYGNSVHRKWLYRFILIGIVARHAIIGQRAGIHREECAPE